MPQSASSSPEEIRGGIRPLLTDNTGRPLRYRPDHGDFVVRNGKEFFNRPLYGPNNAFRVDSGDLPEFSLYLPGHGGNLRLGITTADESKWLFQASEIVTRYRPGRMLYECRDALLDQGTITLEVFTAGEGSGFHACVHANDVQSGLSLIWAFGGASGRKGKRGGDIGCESEPVSRFFQVRPQECVDNRYKINESDDAASSDGVTAGLESSVANYRFYFPTNSTLNISDALAWDAGWMKLKQAVRPEVEHPVLIGSVPLLAGSFHIAIRRRERGEEDISTADIAAECSARSAQITLMAGATRIRTPDEYTNASVGALNIAAEAIWDEASGCVMHGGVAWRVPLAGWRGPYVLDALGQHGRAKQQLRHWLARQNVSPVLSGKMPAEGAPDPGSHLARKENMLHSNGDLSHNHYDMNLVFFDVLLRHLLWTGDLEFAREIWPAFVRHLDWERRMFRREYTVGDQKLPLYEAYACIWASDNLQYNGGGAAHSSAYNYYANRSAAQIARLLGNDDSPFEHESALLRKGMEELLWLPDIGTFGESKDLLGEQSVYRSPALWTIYHTIDSEVATPKQAWQMSAERLAALKRIPVHGAGVPEGNWFMLSCSDWLPYIWSLNLLVLAENMHMALALWQCGMSEEAFDLYQGGLLDSMYQGLCPGNFHMTSELDVHRQEAQRDFGDPIGITSRALIEGLFGIKPDLLQGLITLCPGFPEAWDHAALQHRDVDVAWQREGLHEMYEITSHFPKPVALTLRIRALDTRRPVVRVNGKLRETRFDAESVGRPLLIVEVPAEETWKVEVQWHDRVSLPTIPVPNYIVGEALHLGAKMNTAEIDDPQQVLHEHRLSRAGFHTVFVKMQRDDCEWWAPVSFEVKAAPLQPVVRSSQRHELESVDLSAMLRHKITDIFERSYAEPRSPYCSLAIPEQGVGGWAAFDIRPVIDDSGLRSAGGELHTPIGVPFRTSGNAVEPNCLFLSHWNQDDDSIAIPLSGKADRVFLLLAGTTFPQASRMSHAVITMHYRDGSSSNLALRNPDNWWPIEQDYLLDDYLFVDRSVIPPRVDLRSGTTRLIDSANFLGKGREVPGGAANILALALDPTKDLASLTVKVQLYGIILGLLAVTLERGA